MFNTPSPKSIRNSTFIYDTPVSDITEIAFKSTDKEVLNSIYLFTLKLILSYFQNVSPIKSRVINRFDEKSQSGIANSGIFLNNSNPFFPNELASPIHGQEPLEKFTEVKSSTEELFETPVIFRKNKLK